MRVTIIGTGYVGLVSGACFSQLGFNVTCVDRCAKKTASLKAGEVPFYEPGLAEMVRSNAQAGRLQFVDDFAKAPAADAIFIAVGTPPDEKGNSDLSAVWEVVATIAASDHPAALIVSKSTMPPGTTREIGRRLSQHEVASNPEFLREGTAISDFMKPDRVIAGVVGARGREIITALYEPLKAKLFFTSLESSEMIKYASNDLLATRIAYINEMADICEQVGADVEEVAYGMGLDARIGSQFLRAGPGFGGSCFPKDVLALMRVAEYAGARSYLLEATHTSNEVRKRTLAQRVVDAMDGGRGKTLAVLGLTFKPDTDDMREAPSLTIVPALRDAGIGLRLYDPQGMQSARSLLSGDMAWCTSAQEALQGADAALILTEWSEFRQLDMKRLSQQLSMKLVVDLRNMFTLEAMRSAGLRYISVGRPEVEATEAQNPLQPPNSFREKVSA